MTLKIAWVRTYRLVTIARIDRLDQLDLNNIKLLCRSMFSLIWLKLWTSEAATDIFPVRFLVKLDKSGRPSKLDRIEKLGRLEKLDRLDKLDRLEKLGNVNKLDRLDSS